MVLLRCGALAPFGSGTMEFHCSGPAGCGECHAWECGVCRLTIYTFLHAFFNLHAFLNLHAFSSLSTG